ncbi:MAG: hypothetical protein LBM71_04660 [Elusimicrobiota bacterium]|jgi:predicted Zn-dependent protease|nr:hypothetical protein [Elusimicrobiota bacterium]
MKKFLLLTLLLISATVSFALTDKDQEIFRAMQDEMIRSTAELKMKDVARPYFITYKIYANNLYYFRAFVGSLTESYYTSSIDALIGIRVGNQKEDNSFFQSNIYSSAPEQSAGLNYDGVRAALWSRTDAAYKEALAVLAKKQAYKRSKNTTEDYADFSAANIASDIEEITPAAIDKTYWEDMAKTLSKQGNLKELETFSTEIQIAFRPIYFLSSEGAKYTKDNYVIMITLNAGGKTKDGFEIKENKTLTYADFKDIPTEKELTAIARNFAEQTAAFTLAPKAEPFIGPVMLEKSAAARLLNAAFGENIIKTKKVLSAANSKDHSMGEFTQKMGLKVMPVNFDVIDNPLLERFNNVKLAGNYKIDDEGVRAQELKLVSSGKLTALPTTRSLIKGETSSNGHARSGRYERDLFAQAAIGNLLFTPQKQIEAKNLKTTFINYCKEEGLDYCYIIRGDMTSGTLNAYKVNAHTGEETPVYGFENPTSIFTITRTLRDIKYAGDDLEVYNFVNNYSAPYSIVTPSVILSELELTPSQKQPARKPLVARP